MAGMTSLAPWILVAMAAVPGRVAQSEAEIDQACSIACASKGFCCNGAVSANMRPSCKQACLTRFRGLDETTCKGNCGSNSAGSVGCEATIGGVTYLYCRTCSDILLTEKCQFGGNGNLDTSCIAGCEVDLVAALALTAPTCGSNPVGAPCSCGAQTCATGAPNYCDPAQASNAPRHEAGDGMCWGECRTGENSIHQCQCGIAICSNDETCHLPPGSPGQCLPPGVTVPPTPAPPPTVCQEPADTCKTLCGTGLGYTGGAGRQCQNRCSARFPFVRRHTTEHCSGTGEPQATTCQKLCAFTLDYEANERSKCEKRCAERFPQIGTILQGYCGMEFCRSQ